MSQEYFSRFGAVESVDRPVDKSTGKNKSFCFVTFKKDGIMKLAVKGKVRSKMFFSVKSLQNASTKLMVKDARQKKEFQNKQWLNSRDMEAMAAVMVAAMAEATAVVMAVTEDTVEAKEVMAAKVVMEAKAVDLGVCT